MELRLWKELINLRKDKEAKYMVSELEWRLKVARELSKIEEIVAEKDWAHKETNITSVYIFIGTFSVFYRLNRYLSDFADKYKLRKGGFYVK